MAQGLEVENGTELSIPLKGDFTHNNLKFKYVNEDASDSVLVDFITLSSLNWGIYNYVVSDMPVDGKKWYLSALVVEKSGHPANAFDGVFYIENIYLGNIPINVEQVIGEGVKVWPNPATEFIYVDAPENASVEVYSVDGRLIASMPVVNATSDINVTRQVEVGSLTSGVYVVTITTTEGTQSLKFVKE